MHFRIQLDEHRLALTLSRLSYQKRELDRCPVVTQPGRDIEATRVISAPMCLNLELSNICTFRRNIIDFYSHS